jgi:hypothetical protein
MADDPSEPLRLARWRRRTTAVFWGAVGVFSIAATVQVALQLFDPAEPPGPAPTCDGGLDALSTSLDAGWRAARRADDGPEAALDRFRAEVGPAWRNLPPVRRACAGQPDRAARLDALERLRYALESRVRVDGGSLAALRQKALGAPQVRGATGDAAAPTDEEAPDPGAPPRPDLR